MMKDEEIDYSDISELDEDFLKNAVLRIPETKSIITIRLDKEVLDWFKSKGRGYQTKINDLLRTYMKAHR
jgi:uncharacterized protein (DUF4415 family)